MLFFFLFFFRKKNIINCNNMIINTAESAYSKKLGMMLIQFIGFSFCQSQEATLLLQRARSMTAWCNCGWAGLLAEERDPRRYIMAERSSEKLSLQRSQLSVWLQHWLCFVAIIEASFLQTTLAVRPIPPDAEKTRGEKQPWSISLTRLSYALLFSCCRVKQSHGRIMYSKVEPRQSNLESSRVKQSHGRVMRSKVE